MCRADWEERHGAGRARLPAAVLGATGLVGQVFCWMLERHPWFRPVLLSASDGRVGRRYRDAVNWQLPVPMPGRLGDMTLGTADPTAWTTRHIRLVFSALPADVAGKMEPELAQAGWPVFTNAVALRHRPDVPILLPDVNGDQLDTIDRQPWRQAGGFVVANGNCAVTGLAVALAPLRDLGIRDVCVTTCQSLSGAGLSALTMTDPVRPHIPGEEEKVERELGEIFGEPVPVAAMCNRVPVRFGHLIAVWVTFRRSVGKDEIVSRWRRHTGPDLPSMPDRPVIYRDSPDWPWARACFDGRPSGQPVWTGGLQVHGNRAGFRVLVHNLVRGAAGGSILNAEYAMARGKLSAH